MDMVVSGANFVWLQLQVSHVKDRQHRSRGGLEFSCITPKPKGIEGCVICQIKANILLYLLVGSNMEFLIYQEKYKIKSDFFTFIFVLTQLTQYSTLNNTIFHTCR